MTAPEPQFLVIALLLAPFAYIFGRAFYLEVRRYLLHGPSENRRASFPIDESAPSYEAPDETADADEAEYGQTEGPQRKEGNKS